MCGIIGIIGSPQAPLEVYQGLFTLQHRGQDAAGILSFDDKNNKFNLVKNRGSVLNVFNQNNLEKLNGSMALGHTRYSTIGADQENDIQPLLLNWPFGLGMVHNGNIINHFELAEELNEVSFRHCLTGNDLEVIENIFSEALGHAINNHKSGDDKQISIDDLSMAVKAVFERALGGYSVIGLVGKHGLLAFRDPKGIRPLVIGFKDNPQKSYILASESKTLEYLGYRFVRDVRPGEVIFIDSKCNFVSRILTIERDFSPCMFEWVYFASAESILENRSVYSVRLKLGLELAKKIKKMIRKKIIDPDIVAPIPDTSRTAAISLAEYLKLPYREVLIKNRYIGRSFILNTEKARNLAVNLKFSPVKDQIKGRKILLVDDSIVRGTTARKLVSLLKSAQAKEIYLASTCPPILWPCYYGIDFPNSQQLLAYHHKDSEGIEMQIGAHKVIYIDLKDLTKSINLKRVCQACLDGKYPTILKGKYTTCGKI